MTVPWQSCNLKGWNHLTTACDRQAFDTYMRDTTAKLSRKIEDLEDVHAIMPILKEVCADGLMHGRPNMCR